MPNPTCPICKSPAAPLAANPAFPFCSDRCKVVDLSRWLGGDYGIPVSDDDEDAQQAAPPAPPRTVH